MTTAGAAGAGAAGAGARATAADVEAVFRAEYGRAVAVLTGVFGDIDVAEEAVQDAFAVAVQRWPATGLPPSPAGWIITTARRRAIDRLRRESSRDDRQAQAVLLHATALTDDGLTGGPGTGRRPGGGHASASPWNGRTSMVRPVISA